MHYCIVTCKVHLDENEAPKLDCIQVAEQQGKYLARLLNSKAKGVDLTASKLAPFRYRHMGSMATTGAAFSTFCAACSAVLEVVLL